MTVQPVSIDDVLSAIGIGPYHHRLLWLTGSTLFADGTELMVLPLLQVALEHDPRFSSQAGLISSITSSVFIGMLLGAALVGPCSDRYGRRITTLGLMAMLTVFGLLSSQATTIPALLVSRFFVGVAVAGTPSALTLFTESLPPRHRGQYTVRFMYFFSAGAVTITLLAWYSLPIGSWPLLLLLAAVPPATALVFCALYLPSSARYLLSKDNHRDAWAALQAIATANNQSQALDKYEPDQLTLTLTSADSPASLTKQVQPQVKTETTPVTRAIFQLLCLEFLLMAVVYYFLVLVTVKVETLEHTNEPASRASTAGLSDVAFRNIVLANVAELPGLMAASYCLDKFGRKRTIAGFFVVTAVALLAIASLLLYDQSNRQFIAAIVWIARAAALGFNQSLWIFTTEVFPTHQRASLLGWATAFARIGGALSPWLADSLFERHPSGSCLLAASVSVVAAFIILKVPLETARQPLREDG
eukprot:m.193661 g.193661  ORF g.193661 m.193661 type:complete len:474 (+) comp16982_c0_seq4:144-1565(+)